MPNSLLDVALPPDVAREDSQHRAGDLNAEKVIIIKQVFDSEQMQENLCATCRLLANDAGVRLIAVEGARGQVRPDPRQPSIAELIKGSEISAGVLHLLNSEAASVEVWGVDEPELIAPSRQAMNELGKPAVTQLRDRVFTVIRQLLRAAQSVCYPATIAQLRAGALKLYGVDLSLAEQISLIKQASQDVGLDLRDFPQISRYEETLAREKQINWDRAASQRERFIQRMVDHLLTLFRAQGQQIQFDLLKVRPALKYWMEAMGLTPDELERNIGLRGVENVLLDCKQWIEAWIIESAVQAKQAAGRYGAATAAYQEELMRLALLTGVRYFDLFDFRRYVVYLREVEGGLTPEGLLNELSECLVLLIETLKPPCAARLREIEDQLDLLYRSLRLALPPNEAEVAEVEQGRLIALLDDLRRLVKQELPAALTGEVEMLDHKLGLSREFLECSLQRGRLMAKRTLELTRERGEDRVILVAGGFHPRTVTRVLEDYPRLSWAGITPRFDLETYRQQRPDYSGMIV